MKEMIYKETWSQELLEYNTYKGYNYVVISQGVFPCGYVEIPKDHPCYGIDFHKSNILCHGGLTFSGKLADSLNLPTNTFWLGWDYGHYGDLMGYMFSYSNIVTGHGYTTEDVVQECHNVIDQLEAARCNM